MNTSEVRIDIKSSIQNSIAGMMFSVVITNPERAEFCAATPIGENIRTDFTHASEELNLYMEFPFDFVNASREELSGIVSERLSTQPIKASEIEIAVVSGTYPFAYFADNRGRFVRRYNRGEKLRVRTTTIIFPCHFDSLDDAVGEGVYKELHSLLIGPIRVENDMFDE